EDIHHPQIRHRCRARGDHGRHVRRVRFGPDRRAASRRGRARHRRPAEPGPAGRRRPPHHHQPGARALGGGLARQLHPARKQALHAAASAHAQRRVRAAARLLGDAHPELLPEGRHARPRRRRRLPVRAHLGAGRRRGDHHPSQLGGSSRDRAEQDPDAAVGHHRPREVRGPVPRAQGDGIASSDAAPDRRPEPQRARPAARRRDGRADEPRSRPAAADRRSREPASPAGDQPGRQLRRDGARGGAGRRRGHGPRQPRGAQRPLVAAPGRLLRALHSAGLQLHGHAGLGAAGQPGRGQGVRSGHAHRGAGQHQPPAPGTVRPRAPGPL
ncbi:MAG: hypothetical protein AVDCRST_MAG89-4129, partial [uncultured Gemmatimonadetes bacterium]